MVSTRYLYAVMLLLALALIPTVIHSYVGLAASDGKTARGISSTLAGAEGMDTSRSPSWAREHFMADDFIERRYGADATLFVARSYDMKRLYHHPELAAAWGRSYNSAVVARVPSRVGPVTVHVLTGLGGLACYVLLYDGEFVERPYLFHSQQALAMLFGPKKQTTLFFAHGPAATVPADSPVMRIVVAAVEDFVAPSSATQ
jgi:hypothetical protein